MSDIKIWPDPHNVTIVYKRGYGPMDGDDAVERIEPPNYIEDGVGSIARGLYRLEQEQGPRVASDECQRVLSFFRVEWLEIMKRLRAEHPEEFSADAKDTPHGSQ